MIASPFGLDPSNFLAYQIVQLDHRSGLTSSLLLGTARSFRRPIIVPSRNRIGNALRLNGSGTLESAYLSLSARTDRDCRMALTTACCIDKKFAITLASLVHRPTASRAQQRSLIGDPPTWKTETE